MRRHTRPPRPDRVGMVYVGLRAEQDVGGAQRSPTARSSGPEPSASAIYSSPRSPPTSCSSAPTTAPCCAFDATGQTNVRETPADVPADVVEVDRRRGAFVAGRLRTDSCMSDPTTARCTRTASRRSRSRRAACRTSSVVAADGRAIRPRPSPLRRAVQRPDQGADDHARRDQLVPGDEHRDDQPRPEHPEPRRRRNAQSSGDDRASSPGSRSAAPRRVRSSTSRRAIRASAAAPTGRSPTSTRTRASSPA